MKQFFSFVKKRILPCLQRQLDYGNPPSDACGADDFVRIRYIYGDT